MSEVHRICPHCGGDSPLNARHCPACGQDTLAPPVDQRNLPATVGRAMLPVAVSVAGFALRAGWKLLQSRMAQDAAQAVVKAASQRNQPPATQSQQAPVSATPQPPKRTVRIRSTWSVGDGQGNWRHGREEHVIEYDE